jgi:hypothetical protein
MKKQNWFLGTAALSLLMGGTLTHLQAQPDRGNAPKAGNPANRVKGKNKRGNRSRAAMLPRRIERETALIEKVAGKPLTAAQKAQLKTAITQRYEAQQALQKRYMAQVSKITGITEEQMRQKMRQNRMGQRDNNR